MRNNTFTAATRTPENVREHISRHPTKYKIEDLEQLAAELGCTPADLIPLHMH